jgi:hypothetical protein
LRKVSPADRRSLKLANSVTFDRYVGHEHSLPLPSTRAGSSSTLIHSGWSALSPTYVDWSCQATPDLPLPPPTCPSSTLCLVSRSRRGDGRSRRRSLSWRMIRLRLRGRSSGLERTSTRVKRRQLGFVSLRSRSLASMVLQACVTSHFTTGRCLSNNDCHRLAKPILSSS